VRILVSACLLLAACGSRSGSIAVRIANIGNGLQTYCMPVTLASMLGYYKQEGLDATLVNLPSNAKTLEALIGGSVDVAVIHSQQTIQMAAEGQRVRSFFVLNRLDTKVLIVAPAAAGRIRRAEDLKGALIGVSAPGSSAHQWVIQYLAIHGIRAGDVSVIGIGLGPSAVAAVESGRIDAAALSGGDQFPLLRRHPDLRVLIDGSTPEGTREIYGSDAYAGGTLSAKQEWLDRNPDIARRLTRALQRSLQWIATHSPGQIRDGLPSDSRSRDAAMDIDIIRWSLPSFTSDGTMPEGAPESMKHFLDATVEKVRDSKIDLAATWTNQFLPEPK
jgi:NitT/TauT family transport system substrate-binding protein